jgi:hypothetical protein
LRALICGCFLLPHTTKQEQSRYLASERVAPFLRNAQIRRVSLWRLDLKGLVQLLAKHSAVVCFSPRLFISILSALSLVATLAAARQTVRSGETPSRNSHVNMPSRNHPYKPITSGQRWWWFVRSTVGPQSLAAGAFSAGFGTALDTPKEYRGTWEGFGKRYGMRLTGISTGNAIEAGLGELWGEDPRYLRRGEGPFSGRIRSSVQMTFLAPNRCGRPTPAYARYLGIAGNNVLSNTWRPGSESDWNHAAVRTLLGFAGRMGSNAFQEFWPDIRKRLFQRKHAKRFEDSLR